MVIGWDGAISALLIGCCCAALIIWIIPRIWFNVILSILIALYPVQFSLSDLQDCKDSATLFYIEFAIFLRSTAESFFFDYILYVALKTLFVHP